MTDSTTQPPEKPDDWRSAILRQGMKRLNLAMALVSAIEVYARLAGLTTLREEVAELQAGLWEVHRVLNYLYRGEKE